MIFPRESTTSTGRCYIAVAMHLFANAPPKGTKLSTSGTPRLSKALDGELHCRDLEHTTINVVMSQVAERSLSI